MEQHCSFTVGILIPTYNRCKFLEIALTSVLEQSYRDLEIIVIDNNSTDGTFEFMSVIEDNRLTYVVNNYDIGLTGSINKGISLFSQKVKWCTVICDDDFMHYNFVKTMQHFVSTNDTKSVILSNITLIDALGNKIREVRSRPPFESAYDYILNRCDFNRETFLTGILFSRQKFNEIGGYPCFATGMATDDAFIYAIALKNKVFYCNDALAYVRIHEDAESYSKSGIINHMLALYNYKMYIDTLSKGNRQYIEQELNTIETAVNSYVMKLNSDFWLRNIAFILKKSRRINDNLFELFEICDDHRYQFDIRVKIFKIYNRLFINKHKKYIVDMHLIVLNLILTSFEYCSERSCTYRFVRDTSLKLLSRLTKPF